MNPAEFLALVWPDEGPYALATPYTPPGSDTAVYAHKVFGTIAEAAAFADRVRLKNDVFYCVHALREPRVWNPTKVDRKTGKRGAYEVRTQRNMRAARVFFFDFDIGPETTKYPTREAAVKAVDSFCKSVRLPLPMLVSSGRGIHAYWRLDNALASDDWRLLAIQLKRLAVAYGLRFDPMRTTDTASVLRVAGTFNFKDPEAPKAVKVLRETLPQTLKDWTAHLQAGLILMGAPQDAPALHMGTAPSPGSEGLGSNLDRVYDGPSVTLKALGRVCGQVRAFARARGNVPEPAWYAMLQLIRHVEDGEFWCHTLSAGHPQYDRDETDKKLAQLAARNVGPTTCSVLADRCGESICQKCPHLGKIKSPIAAARFKDPAPAPVLTSTAVVETPFTLPDPPAPFIRMKSGQIGVTISMKDGEEQTLVIYDHDLYPVRRIVDADRGIEQQVWRVHLPRCEPKDFVVDASALYRPELLAAQLANNGVYPKPSRIREMQEYMSAYISELQKHHDANASHNALGWHDDFQRFVLPTRTLHRDGRVTPAQLTQHAETSAATISKSGTLERQVELMRFYAHPQYRAHQFLVLGSLAAPLFHMTGHHGVVINATGEPGSSKSTSLYTAASIWAHPQKYPLNGTNHGASQKARAQRMITMGSLPVCVDEITTMAHRDAQELVMNVTQPEGRIVLSRDGKERRPGDGEKSTIMLCTGNNSLHTLLSHENVGGTAGSMRVVELKMYPGKVHQKHEADEYLHALRENYGHLGEAFLAHVVVHYAAVAERIRTKNRALDDAVQTESAERFWTAAMASVLVAGEIGCELGLLAYDMPALQRWCIDDLMPSMRGVVAAEYGNSASILADYLEQISGQILITNRGASGPYVLRVPNGAMSAHYQLDTGTMYVLRKAFRDHCVRIGADLDRILKELSRPTLDTDGRTLRVITNPAAKFQMGSGTEFAKLATTCIAVNMKHPEVTGAVNLSVVESRPTVTTPARGTIRAVT